MKEKTMAELVEEFNKKVEENEKWSEYSYSFTFDFPNKKLILVSAVKNDNTKWRENHIEFGVVKPTDIWKIYGYIYEESHDRLQENIKIAEDLVWKTLKEKFGVN